MFYTLLIATTLEIYEIFLSKLQLCNKALVFIQEEEYKRLSEALAEDGHYNAVGFTYGSDYYDPSQPTEEEEPSKQRGEAAGVRERFTPSSPPARPPTHTHVLSGLAEVALLVEQNGKLGSVSRRNDRKERTSPCSLRCCPCRRRPLGVALTRVSSFCTEKSEADNVEENEEPFVAPLGLSVPPDVELVRAALPGLLVYVVDFPACEEDTFRALPRTETSVGSHHTTRPGSHPPLLPSPRLTGEEGGPSPQPVLCAASLSIAFPPSRPPRSEVRSDGKEPRVRLFSTSRFTLF